MRRRAFAGKKRTWQRGVMNQGEQAYADHLDTLKAAGHITEWYYEAQSSLIGPNCRLTPDFTVQDLRREYRQLARRIHPDRHNSCTPAERERLSRQFAELSDSYRHLLVATASSN